MTTSTTQTQAPVQQSTPPVTSERKRKEFTFRREWVLLGILLVLGTIMSFLSPYFLEKDNLLELTRYLAETGIIACGMTLIIMTGGIDLSVGRLLGLSGIVLGYSWQAWGPVPALVLCVLTGLGGGALNGAMVTRGHFPPLVVTLATWALFRGISMVISRAQPVSDFPEWFAWIGQEGIGPVPAQLIVWLVIVAISIVLVEKTSLGRYTTAIGDNEKAARFAALPVDKVKFGLYTLTGLLCALAAIIFTSRVSTAKADAGEGLELEVITAVVLGGTAITGGRGTVIGTFLGVLILGVLRNGLNLRGVPSVWQTILSGVILIATAIVNQRMLERPVTRKK